MRTKVWVPSTRLKNQVWWLIPITQHLASGAPGSVGDPFSKSNVEGDKEHPTWTSGLYTHALTYILTYIHVHTHMCTHLNACQCMHTTYTPRKYVCT